MANDSHNTTSSEPAHETQGGVALDRARTQSAGSANSADSTRAKPAVARPKTTAQLVGEAATQWRRALVELAGDSSLANVELLGDSVLNLTQAHPSGIAQLFAGRPTRLANIFREAASLPLARSRTRSVANHAQAQSEKYGISPTYLAIGVATWTEHEVPDPENDVAALARVAGSRPELEGNKPVPAPKPVVVRAPVLLRPISIASRSAESDYELSLEHSAEINPILSRALRSRGALLDPAALARGAFTGNGFDPSTVLDRINSLGQAVLPDFQLTDTLLVGTFVHPGQVLVDDLDDLHAGLERHEIIAALAGSEPAREALKVELPPPGRADADPSLERGVGDLDVSGRAALEALATGNSLFIDAPVGSDTTGVAAAILAEAAAIGRNVLYVPGHRRAAMDLTARMRSLDLDDLLLDVVPSPNWRTLVTRRLLSAMTLASNPVDHNAIAQTRVELSETRTRLASMVDGLHVIHEVWGISAYDALQALARLTSQRPAPSTKVRFDTDTLLRIASGLRDRISQDLRTVAELDGFTIRPTSTPWFGANLETSEAAHTALTHVTALVPHSEAGDSLAAMSQQIERVAEFTGLVPATTLAQWTAQVQMLEGMREILDQFQPLVYESSVDDLVAATATKQWRAEQGVEMSGVHRRRLVKRAKDMVRPGVRVADLHEALVRIKGQREVWAQHCPSGGWPRLPEGFRDILDTHATVMKHVAALEPVLKTTPLGGDLSDTPLDELTKRLEALRDDAVALDTLPQRTAILRSLMQIGLGDLLKDFTKRKIDPLMMDAELDLAWWASVCEDMLAANPFLQADPEYGFERYAQRFRELDRAHVASLAQLIKTAAIEQNQSTLRNYRSQGEGLFTVLVEERLTSVRAAYEEYTDVMRRLRPCMIATATMVPHLLPAHRMVDLVVLDAVQHMPVEQLLSAIARGRQVVVIGDARCASGGAITQLSELLPRIELTGDAVHRDTGLTRFLMKHGYAGVLKPLPLPKPTSLIQFEQVFGTGMPNQKAGAVLSTEVEVQRVVDLVIEHVLDRAHESLAVIAGSGYHAERLREALEQAKRNNVVLANFFDSGHLEPAIVADLSEVAGLSRDAVILSLGFGRTPHGRTLHRFGAISQDGGDGLLLNALGVTRRRLTVVSCFGLEDLDVTRLRTRGARMLGSLLDFAAGGAGNPIIPVEEKPATQAARTLPEGKVSARPKPQEQDGTPEISDEPETTSNTAPSGADEQAEDAGTQDENTDVTGSSPSEETEDEVTADGDEREGITHNDDGSEPDRLLVDLADRLWQYGLTVETNYGFDGSERIPLVAGHPDYPGEYFVAVLTDDLRYVAEGSLRTRDRHRIERLESLGWQVITLWSVPLFLDPVAQADAVRDAVFNAHAQRVRAAAARVQPVIDGEATNAVLAHENAALAGQDMDSLLVAEDRSARFAGGATQPSLFAADEGAHDGRGPRPDVPFGLPINAYGDNQLDELVAWISRDGITRGEEELAAQVREELGIRRRSHRVDTAISNAIRRSRV